MNVVLLDTQSDADAYMEHCNGLGFSCAVYPPAKTRWGKWLVVVYED